MELSSFKLERYFAKHEFGTKYLLCSSDCESFDVDELLRLENGAETDLKKLRLGYTESLGKPSLRKEISNLYEEITIDQVLVHSGAEEAIFLLMNAILNEDDHVIVQSPCYQSLKEIPKSKTNLVDEWKGKFDKEWYWDLNELKSLIQKNTKLIVINNPHNPTGYLMSNGELNEINKLAIEKNIIVFSDEVYKGLEYSDQDSLPAFCDINHKAVSLGVMSKTYGLAGLRIGWIATQNKIIYKKVAAMKDYTTICNSAPSEFLAEIALRNRDKLVERNIDIIKTNLQLVEEFMNSNKKHFAWYKPKAGPIAFPKLVGKGIEQFCDALVKEKSVLLLPGTLYDDRNNHFRIGLARKNLPVALSELNQFISSKH